MPRTCHAQPSNLERLSSHVCRRIAGLATWAKLTFARAQARRRWPRATRVGHSRLLPAPRLRPSLPSIPPPLQLTYALRRAQGEGATTFSSTLVVKESLHILAGYIWQHDEAVRSRIGRILSVSFAGTGPFCVRVKFCFPSGRRIGQNAHVGAPIGVVWEAGRPCRPSRGRQGRAGGVTVQGSSSPN